MNEKTILAFLENRGWTSIDSIIRHFNSCTQEVAPLLDSLFHKGLIEQEYGQTWAITLEGKEELKK